MDTEGDECFESAFQLYANILRAGEVTTVEKSPMKGITI